MQRLVALVSVPLLTLTTSLAVLVVASPAHAENRCGTAFAGKFKNNSGSRSINVTGDTASSGSVTRLIGPGSSAAANGICDADFFAPRSAYYRVITTGVYQYYNANTQQKIGAGSASCQDSYVSSHPLVCNW